jgi:uroporphyrinogen decarboxylase
MTARERFHAILNGESDRPGFWHGNPHEESTAKLYSYFDVSDDFELGRKLGSVCRFVSPEGNRMWQRTDYPMFDPFNTAQVGKVKRTSLGQEGVFADCEDVGEIHAYHWPTVADCDFTQTLREIDRTLEAGQAVLSGTWGSIFSNTWSFFGMENCFVKMHTNPEQVEAVTGHLTDFYLSANEALFALAGDRIDALFIGIDLGSQLDLLISPEAFERFLLPYITKLVDQAHRHGHYLVMHSCGSIYRVIPQLIRAGVDVLHPLQAMAKNMDAESLSQYNGQVVFMGAVDTQRILPFGRPEEVRAEVRRLRKLFGPNYIVSPSHETLLPNVPPENVAAMVEAVRG